VNAVVEACEELGIRPVDFVDEPQRESPRAPAPDRGRSMGVLAETRVDTEDPEQSTAEADVSPSIAGPFSGYSEDSGFPDPREASPANVRDILRQIIERDGPLTRTSVYRLYVEGCPDLQRVGKIVRQALNRALGAMLRAGEIVQEDELRDGSPEGQVIRIAGTPAVNVRPAGRRDLIEIPPSELIAVLARKTRSTGPAANDEALFRILLDEYGFQRLTRQRREYLSKVIRLFREQV
jgi:hypothetical protein